MLQISFCAQLSDPLKLRSLKCEILSAETVKSSGFWDVMPCSLVAVYQSFVAIFRLDLRDLSIYKTIWRHNKEHSSIHA
jgi:hypothetical protein